MSRDAWYRIPNVAGGLRSVVSMATPEELERLIDEAAIIRLTHAYCWALDTGTWDDLRSVFTPDVVTDLGAGGQTGIDEVIERVSSALSAFETTQHLVATHQIEIDGDAATCRCYLQAQHVRPDGEKLLIGARYEDENVRTDEGWRIARRRIVPMWVEGAGGIKS